MTVARSLCAVLLSLSALVAAAKDAVIENARFRLTVADDATVRSLKLTTTGEECVPSGEQVPLFSVTQGRAFNNEIKLVHPNKRTTYPANAVCRDGDRLIVGCRIASYEAVDSLKVTDAYVAFKLTDFIVDKTDAYYGKCTPRPGSHKEFTRRYARYSVWNKDPAAFGKLSLLSEDPHRTG